MEKIRKKKNDQVIDGDLLTGINDKEKIRIQLIDTKICENYDVTNDNKSIFISNKKKNLKNSTDTDKSDNTTNTNSNTNSASISISNSNSNSDFDEIEISKNDKNSFNEEYEDVIEISELKGKEIDYYNMIDKFFSNCDYSEIEKMIDIINGNNLVSLRFLDWFVTRFCYLYKLSIKFNNKFTNEDNFNINISYKAQLKSFKKKYFDPFRRKKKFYFVINKDIPNQQPKKYVILTTLGQLNFFKWAISFNIIKYTENNYKDILSKFSHVNSYFKKNKSDSKSDSDKNTDEPLLSSNKNIMVNKLPTVTRNINLEL